MGKSLLSNAGGEDEIVDQVNHEMALKMGEIKEIKSDDEEEDEQEEDIKMGELICLCEKWDASPLNMETPRLLLTPLEV